MSPARTLLALYLPYFRVMLQNKDFWLYIVVWYVLEALNLAYVIKQTNFIYHHCAKSYGIKTFFFQIFLVKSAFRNTFNDDL